MSKLFVDKSIDVNASSQRVWDVLTLRQHTAEWASEFSAGGPGLYIESGWDLGSPVLWKDKKGMSQGTVTAPREARPSPVYGFDVREKPPQLRLRTASHSSLPSGGKTTLWVSQGDFTRARWREVPGAERGDLGPRLTRVKWHTDILASRLI
jgi:hypothetical protein